MVAHAARWWPEPVLSRGRRGRIRPGSPCRRLLAGSWPATALLPEDERHLVSRFSYAVTPALAQQVRDAGGRTWFDGQLATAYDGSADNLADWWPHLHLGPTAVWELQTSGTRFGYRVMYDYGRRLLVRRLVSPRPVLETMTEFWGTTSTSRSTVTRSSPGGPATATSSARTRWDASTSAPDAIVHPAMLIYLDAANSTADHPSENLARSCSNTTPSASARSRSVT